MSNQFKGIPLHNNGENLCFCNSGTNAILSSEQITSRIFQHHCDTCEILCRLKNSSLPNFQETCTNCGSKTFQEHHEKTGTNFRDKKLKIPQPCEYFGTPASEMCC